MLVTAEVKARVEAKLKQGIALAEAKYNRHQPFPASKGAFTVAEALKMAEDPRVWNPTFDRKQIPLMEQIIHKHISPLHRPVDERFVF